MKLSFTRDDPLFVKHRLHIVVCLLATNALAR